MQLQLHGVGKKYEDSNEVVLNSVSLNVEQGEFVCVVGKSGCGKSTLLKLIAGLEQPSCGQMLLNGKPITKPGADRVVMFQDHALFPWLTVEENVKFNLKIKGYDKKTIEERTEKILDIIGLKNERNAYPHQLSVSAEQRVVIGRSFALYPDLLLMDEPYGQMDIKVRYYLEDEVLKLWRETGSTVLFITHNIEEAIYLSQKCLIMTKKPTQIKAIVDNPLPYPRDVSSEEFIKLREEVTDMIKWW